MWCCGSCGSECVTGKFIVSKPTSNQQFHTHKQVEAQQPAHSQAPPLGRGKGLWRGVGEPLFSPCQKGINEFVSGSHVAELIQHQKVIDYTATYKRATAAIFDLLRPSTRISLGHTPPHGQTPSGPHTAAHGPALTSRACCAAPNGRDSILHCCNQTAWR